MNSAENIDNPRVDDESKAYDSGYREIFDASVDAILIHNAETGAVSDVNLRFCQMYECTREEAISLGVGGLSADEDSYTEAVAFELIHKAYSEDPQVFDWKARKGTGELFWVEVNLKRAIINEEVCVLAFVRDISERKQSEEVLQRELAVNSAMAALSNALVDTKASVEEIAEIVLDFSKSLTNSDHGFVSSINPDTRDNVPHTLTKMMDSELPFLDKNKNLEFPIGSDGKYPKLFGHALNTRKAFYTNSPDTHQASTGTPQGHIAIKNFLAAPAVIGDKVFGQIALANKPVVYSDRDLEAIKRLADLYALALKRKRDEEALQISEEKYRDLVENINDVIFAIDFEGNFTYISPTVKAIFGYEPEIIVGQPFVSFIFEDDQLSMRQRFGEILAGKLTPSEFRLVSETDEIHWVRTSSRPIVKEGRAVGIQGVLSEITELKHAEGERRRLETRIQQAQKMESLSLLAGGVSHDYNNLLQSILGNADLALMDLSPLHPAWESIEALKKSAAQAAHLTMQMLAFTGNGIYEPRRFNLSSLVEQSERLLKSTISDKALLKLELTEDLPLIEADVSQVRQAILNVVTNASEALEDSEGLITLTTGLAECNREYLCETSSDEDLPEGRYVYIKIKDTGAGMKKDTIARIFDPFFSTKFTGRGLGLAAVFGIMRSHNGAIKVESQPGEDSTFTLLFPVIADDTLFNEGAEL